MRMIGQIHHLSVAQWLEIIDTSNLAHPREMNSGRPGIDMSFKTQPLHFPNHYQIQTTSIMMSDLAKFTIKSIREPVSPATKRCLIKQYHTLSSSWCIPSHSRCTLCHTWRSSNPGTERSPLGLIYYWAIAHRLQRAMADGALFGRKFTSENHRAFVQ